MKSGRLLASTVVILVSFVDLALAAAFFFFGGTVLGLDREAATILAGALVLGALGAFVAGLVLRKKALAEIGAERGAVENQGDRPVVWRRSR